MKTTADFLDDLQKKLGVESDYALGKALGMQRQQVSHYRNLKGAFDDEKSILVAETLGIDPAYVAACMHLQRAKEPKVKAMWERMALSMSAVAAAILVVFFLPYFGAHSSSEYVSLVGSIAAKTEFDSLYIMRN